MADLRNEEAIRSNPVITTPPVNKSAQEAAKQEAQNLKESNVTYGPQTPEQERKNKISVSGSTLGAGIEYDRILDDKGRFSTGAGLHSGGAFDGPFVTAKANYDFLQGTMNTSSLGTIKGTVGVGPLVGIGPDTAVGAVMLNSGVTFNDRVTVDLGVGPAVYVPFDDRPYSQPFGGALAKFGVGVKF